MTLSRRISFGVLAVVAVTSLALAVLSAITGRNSATRQVDNRLLALRAVVTQDGIDPVDSLLRSLQTLPTNFVAALAVDDEAVIDLIAADNPDSLRLDSLERDVLLAAAVSPQTIAGREPIRISAIDLGTGDWLVFGEGIGDITGSFANQLLINCAIAVVVAVFGGLVTHQFTRRSFAPLGDIIKYSQTVAAGRLDASLPTDAHTDEVRELQSNISSMVSELQNAVNIKSRSEQQMREFLADVAHELRTPLTTVRAYADVLASQQSVEPEMRQRAQDRIAYESKRMTRLIDDLLLLARLSSTPLSDHESIDISSVISSHFHDLKVLDPSRKLTIDSPPFRVEADPALMDRLFANLSSNIHRHTPSSAEVSVRCTSDNGTVTCTIDDAGPGLDDSQLSLLAVGAERFSTLRTGDHHGTGLGLHLVASIARLHGGSATFERSPLGGLRVVVTLSTTHGRHSANDARHHSAKDACP